MRYKQSKEFAKKSLAKLVSSREKQKLYLEKVNNILEESVHAMI